MANVQALAKRVTFLLKLVELILAIVCAAVVGAKGPALTTSGVHVVFVAIHGYIAINIISMLSYIMETHLHKYINVVIAVSGAAMFFAAGGLMLEAYNSVFQILNYLLSAGVIALITGVVYLVDAALSFKEDLSST